MVKDMKTVIQFLQPNKYTASKETLEACIRNIKEDLPLLDECCNLSEHVFMESQGQYDDIAHYSYSSSYFLDKMFEYKYPEHQL